MGALRLLSSYVYDSVAENCHGCLVHDEQRYVRHASHANYVHYAVPTLQGTYSHQQKYHDHFQHVTNHLHIMGRVGDLSCK